MHISAENPVSVGPNFLNTAFDIIKSSNIEPAMGAFGNLMGSAKASRRTDDVNTLYSEGVCAAHDGRGVVWVVDLVEDQAEMVSSPFDAVREALPSAIRHQRPKQLDDRARFSGERGCIRYFVGVWVVVFHKGLGGAALPSHARQASRDYGKLRVCRQSLHSALPYVRLQPIFTDRVMVRRGMETSQCGFRMNIY